MSSIPKKVAERIQQLERMRQDFVANVSHELRTPLTVIHGYLELLLDSEGDENQKNIYTEMQQQTLRMQSLIEDLLLLSRLESDDVESTEHNTLVDASALITNICAEAKTLSAGEHKFELHIQPKLYLYGNGKNETSQKELRSLFSNLIFNAVKYTPSGGKIFVEWVVRDHHAVFSVRDTGIGIEAHHIPRLTERFYRVDPGRSRASGGTGLGLAIAKHVLIRHKGKLDIQSVFGEGSVFTCIFPEGQYTITPFIRG